MCPLHPGLSQPPLTVPRGPFAEGPGPQFSLWMPRGVSGPRGVPCGDPSSGRTRALWGASPSAPPLAHRGSPRPALMAPPPPLRFLPSPPPSFRAGSTAPRFCACAPTSRLSSASPQNLRAHFRFPDEEQKSGGRPDVKRKDHHKGREGGVEGYGGRGPPQNDVFGLPAFVLYVHASQPALCGSPLGTGSEDGL